MHGPTLPSPSPSPSLSASFSPQLLADALVNISLVAALLLSVGCTFLVVPAGGEGTAGVLDLRLNPNSFLAFGFLFAFSVMMELVCILSCIRTLMSLDALDGPRTRFSLIHF